MFKIKADLFVFLKNRNKPEHKSLENKGTLKIIFFLQREYFLCLFSNKKKKVKKVMSENNKVCGLTGRRINKLNETISSCAIVSKNLLKFAIFVL